MVPLESLGTVSYSHSIATVAVSLAVSARYTNLTDTQPCRHRTTGRAALCSLARLQLSCSKMCWIPAQVLTGISVVRVPVNASVILRSQLKRATWLCISNGNLSHFIFIVLSAYYLVLIVTGIIIKTSSVAAGCGRHGMPSAVSNPHL